jgi:hypothetical protein
VKDALMRGLKTPTNSEQTPTNANTNSNTNFNNNNTVEVKKEDKDKSDFARKAAKSKTELNVINNQKSTPIAEESESASGTDASLSQEKAVLESLKDEKINNLEDWLSECNPSKSEIPSLS